MASSRTLCKFVLVDMPFDAPSAHATFFRFLSVFFELRIWLFSSSFQPLYDLLFGALFIAVLNALLIALFIALFIARTSLFSSWYANR